MFVFKKEERERKEKRIELFVSLNGTRYLSRYCYCHSSKIIRIPIILNAGHQIFTIFFQNIDKDYSRPNELLRICSSLFFKCLPVLY